MPEFKSFEDLHRSQPTGPESVPERSTETLHLALQTSPEAPADAVERSRRIVLDRLAKHFGRGLPKAFGPGYRAFRVDGHSCHQVRVVDGTGDHWTLRTELRTHPDWVTEVGVSNPSSSGTSPQIGFRVFSRADVPSGQEPRLAQDLAAAIAKEVPLLLWNRRIVCDPVEIDSDSKFEAFASYLHDSNRRLAAVVASVPPEADEPLPSVEQVEDLARTLIGTATVYVLPHLYTFRLSDLVSKQLSVFQGAWRYYGPGFKPGADLYAHPLYLREKLASGRLADVIATIRKKIRQDRTPLQASPGPAFEELRRRAELPSKTKLGPLARIWRRLRGGGTRLFPSTAPPSTEDPGAEADDTLGSLPQATRRSRTGAEISALRRRLRSGRDAISRERERRRKAKRHLARANRRVRQLEELVSVLGGDPRVAVPFPVEWSEVATWCEESLKGRVALLETARRSLDKARFREVKLAARCVRWLATEYRDRRIGGGDPHLHGRVSAVAGVHNLPSAGDAFECSWRGRKHIVDWHLKNGGNTRDPARCLRIYYFWDAASEQVVIGDMPAHRRSAAS